MSPLLHERLAVSASFFTFAMALWAFLLFLRGRGLSSGYMGAVVVGEALLIVEALLGAWRWIAGGVDPERWVHILYGVLAALIWPFVFTYTREADGRVESLLFGAASLFLWGLVVRAMSTAHLLP
jgi:heme A synthase